MMSATYASKIELRNFSYLRIIQVVNTGIEPTTRS
jgi:hypothetical protein